MKTVFVAGFIERSCAEQAALRRWIADHEIRAIPGVLEILESAP